jgi:malonyl-CoA O-methyltransferase
LTASASLSQAEFSAAAASYDSAAFLASETGARMDERLSLTKIEPRRVADIGCATGDGIRALQRRYPAAQALAIDFAMPMLRVVRARGGRMAQFLRKAPQVVCADAAALPLATGSLGLVWSNLMLQWFDDPQPTLLEMHRILDVGGLVMFTSFGPDTLKELREAIATTPVGAGDTPIISGLKKFHDMHDIGDMLLAAGFADPVMDMEMITVNYSHPRKFLADQRKLGVRRQLLGERSWQAWRQIFAAWRPNSDGKFPASFEIVYGHAWKAAPRQPQVGHSVVHFHRRDALKN